MKTKKKWHIKMCILLAMIIAVVCICWTVSGGLYSKTASPTVPTTTTITTTTIAVTTLTSTTSTMTTTSTATTTATEPPSTTNTRTKSPSSAISTSRTVIQTSCSHQYYRPKDDYVYKGRLYWFSAANEKTWGVIPPTCTDEGFTVYICSKCKHEKFEDNVPATGHNLSKELEYVYPGYQKEGYSYYACADCSAIEIVEEFPARKGNLSGIASPVKHSREVFGSETRYDSYIYNVDGTYIRISDLRTWGHMPKITVHPDEGFLLVEYDLENGTMVSERVYFPGENLFYSGSINSNGNLEGAYQTPFQ